MDGRSVCTVSGEETVGQEGEAGAQWRVGQ